MIVDQSLQAFAHERVELAVADQHIRLEVNDRLNGSRCSSLLSTIRRRPGRACVAAAARSIRGYATPPAIM